MMKLLLTSAGLSTQAITDELSRLTGKPFPELKVVFIPTAANNYTDKWFVDKDRNKLIELGMKVVDVDVADKNQQELSTELNNCNIIFVAGGNTFYLLEKMKASGADKIIIDLVKKGVIYIGSSAGSVLVGPSISVVRTVDDPSEAPSLESFDGLKLVDFIVLPHVNNGKYDTKNQAIMEKYSNQYQLIPINDEQAVAVENGGYQII